MTVVMSAITAEAVSVPPAPGPSSVISRIASPWSMTALNAPSTFASGCCLSTSAGLTRTSTWPSTSRAAPTRRITMSSWRAAATSCVRRRCRLDHLSAPPRDELLVRGHDVLAAAKQLEDVRAGGLQPSHHLRDDGDRRVVRDLAEIGREHPARRRVITLLSHVADERLHDAQAVPRRALDVVRRLGQQAVDGRTDGAVPEQCDRYVNRRHGPPRLPRAH